MTVSRLLLLLCALTVALSLPQGGWWPSVLTLPPSGLPGVDSPPPTSPSPPPTQPPPPTAPSQQQSTPACNCPSPPQYNPVCGSDNQTYTNPQKLECARTCGQRVTILYLGTCQLRRK